MRTRRVTLTATAFAVAAAMAAVPVPAAHAGTVKACVNKKTGEVIIKKKCKKGWKQRTWKDQGRKGDTGSQGASGAVGPVASILVRDGTGTVMGRYLNTHDSDGGLIDVLIDGGGYTYTYNGWVLPTGSPYFTDSGCNGTPYVQAGFDQQAMFEAMVGSSLRIVYRPTETIPGPPIQAWQLTNAVITASATPLYYRDKTGLCELDGPHTNLLFALSPVTPPSDVPGPLTYG